MNSNYIGTRCYFSGFSQLPPGDVIVKGLDGDRFYLDYVETGASFTMPASQAEDFLTIINDQWKPGDMAYCDGFYMKIKAIVDDKAWCSVKTSDYMNESNIIVELSGLERISEKPKSGKYRKKPVVIDAFQWTGPEHMGYPEWMGDPMDVEVDDHGHMLIHTLEGTMEASHGDWIIRGVKGEIYPCKPDIFEATYEKAE